MLDDKATSKSYTEDFSFDTADLDAPAMFLPSISNIYISLASQYPEKMTDARHPKGMHRDGRELNFLRDDSTSFHWPYALYSAGHADLKLETNLEKINYKESMLRTRDRSKTIIVGDSGGYQIGKGILDFDWQNFESDKNNKLRMQILKWLEATADISMTLDTPVWGIGNPRCGLKSFGDCLEKTMFNHEFFIKHRTPGATKFLNILHGRNKEEETIWYDTVKNLPFEGWAFADPCKSDFQKLLNRIIIMRDEGQLTKTKNWIHMLGVSRLTSGCAFSQLQRTLRKHVDETMTISYDASSSFLSTAKGNYYMSSMYDSKKLGCMIDKCFDDKALAGSQLPFPILSPIGKKMTVGDICVKGFDIDSKSSWDTYSYIMLMCHNTYMLVKALDEANNLYRMPTKQIQPWFPAGLLEFKDLVEEVFTSEKPFSVISANHKLLNNLSGLRTENKKLSVVQTSSLFSVDGESAVTMDESEDDEHFEDSMIQEL